jgi:hypothetical protein
MKGHPSDADREKLKRTRADTTSGAGPMPPQDTVQNKDAAAKGGAMELEATEDETAAEDTEGMLIDESERRVRPDTGPAGTGEGSSGRVTRASAHSDARGPAMALYGAAVDDRREERGREIECG